ncbi:hypothetical protein L208DRAFT_1341184, partial [Tricholoma matsutake]
LDNKLSCEIAHGACHDSAPNKVQEAGCAVWSVSACQLTRLKTVKKCLHVLQAPGVTRVEQKKASTPVREFKGPVLDYRCNCICDTWSGKGQVPQNALARGLCIGAVPEELSNLNFIEHLLIACI